MKTNNVKLIIGIVGGQPVTMYYNYSDHLNDFS